jgi:hypothetical protein
VNEDDWKNTITRVEVISADAEGVWLVVHIHNTRTHLCRSSEQIRVPAGKRLLMPVPEVVVPLLAGSGAVH